jgi:hypothetical protein
VLSFGSLVRGVDLLNGSYIVGLANGSIFSVLQPPMNADLEIIPEENGENAVAPCNKIMASHNEGEVWGLD